MVSLRREALSDMETQNPNLFPSCGVRAWPVANLQMVELSIRIACGIVRTVALDTVAFSDA